MSYSIDEGALAFAPHSLTARRPNVTVRPTMVVVGLPPEPAADADLLEFGCWQLSQCRDHDAFQAVQRWFKRNFPKFTRQRN